jgi:hypothetical protein
MLQQPWGNAGLITVDNVWNGVPSIQGFGGTVSAGGGAGSDPLSYTALTGADPLQVIANQSVPNATVSAQAGTAEFESGNIVVGLRPDATNRAPNLVLYLDTTGMNGVTVSFDAVDIDDTARDTAQPVAVQYRIAGAGGDVSFINVGGGYAADVTDGGASGRVTPFSVSLPARAEGQARVEVRILTYWSAVADNEWVGIDNIVVNGNRRPLVTTSSGNTTYVENSSATLIDPDIPAVPPTVPPTVAVPGATVTDPDGPSLNGGTVTATITSGLQAGQDILSVTNTTSVVGGNTITFTSSTRAVNFNGTPIGTVRSVQYGTGGQPLVIVLNGAATSTNVTALL